MRVRLTAQRGLAAQPVWSENYGAGGCPAARRQAFVHAWQLVADAPALLAGVAVADKAPPGYNGLARAVEPDRSVGPARLPIGRAPLLPQAEV